MAARLLRIGGHAKRAADGLGAEMLSVYLSGGASMLKAALAGAGGAPGGDQRRVLTPGAAGADYPMIGRPITARVDPRATAERILKEMAKGD